MATLHVSISWFILGIVDLVVRTFSDIPIAMLGRYLKMTTEETIAFARSQRWTLDSTNTVISLPKNEENQEKVQKKVEMMNTECLWSSLGSTGSSCMYSFGKDVDCCHRTAAATVSYCMAVVVRIYRVKKYYCLSHSAI